MTSPPKRTTRTASRLAATATVVGLATAAAAAVAASCGSSVAAAAPCDAAAYRQFDFFVGDWDAFDVAAPRKVVARNRVTPMLEGCALREVYEQNDGLLGESFSAYDAARSVWHQSWVTNRGQLLLLEGRFEGGRMTLLGADRRPTPGASPSLLRAVWLREPDGTVRETAERSIDGGKSWSPVFDMIFRPHVDRGDR